MSKGLVVLAVGCMAALASAQNRNIDSFDAYVANIQILQFKEVQTELKVTAAQRTSLNKHADWFNAESRKVQEAARKSPEDRKIPERLTALLGQMKDRVFKVLTATQLRRLRELSLQSAGPAAILDDRVAQRIGVSKSQLDRMRKTYSDNSQKAAQLQERTFRPIMEKYDKQKPKNDAERKKLAGEMEKEMRAAGQKINPQVMQLAESTRKSIDGMLTAAQKTAFRGLLGKAWNPPAALRPGGAPARR